MFRAEIMAETPHVIRALLEMGVCAPVDTDELLARQAIYGGALELNLLEMGWVDEAGLLRVLARASGLEASPSGPLSVDSKLTDSVGMHGLVLGRAPDGRAVAFVASLPNDKLMAEVEAKLGEAVTPLVCSQLRLLEVAAWLGGSALDERERAQLAKTGQLATAPPVRLLGGFLPAATVIKEPLAHANSSGDGTAPPPADYQELRRSVAPAARRAPPSEHPSGFSVHAAGPLEFSRTAAEAELRAAHTPELIVAAILRYCSQFFEYAAVFALQSAEAKGLASSGPGAPTARVSGLHIPLDLPSAFSRVRDTGEHRLARLRASGLEGGVVRDLERPSGRAVLLIPITVRGKPLLLLWGDGGLDDVDVERAVPALALSSAASAALERVLLERKRGSQMARPSHLPAAPAAATPSSAMPAPPGLATEAPRLAAELPPAPRRSTALGMSILPPRSLPPVTDVAHGDAAAGSDTRPPEDVGGRHDTRRDLAPPEARQISRTLLGGTSHEAAKARKRTLGQSFSEATPPLPLSTPPGASSETASVFPSDHPRTMKGFPTSGELRLSPVSPSPNVAPPLLSRRIVAVAEPDGAPQARRPEPSRSAPPLSTSGGTMLSRRVENESPEPRMPSEAPPPRSLSYTSLVKRLIEGSDEALHALILGGESAVGALIAEFPGPVTDPRTASVPASECGPILKALVSIGAKATPFVTVRTADENATVRRWAVHLLGELTGRDAARAIADRLLDETPEVRRAALGAARRVQSDGTTRRTLRSRLEEMTRDGRLLAEERCAAIEAIADIREHESIPTLLQLLDDESTAVKRAARWALSVLTRHDFGADAAGWQQFWLAHRNDGRANWLVLSLAAGLTDLSRAAAEELETLLGQPLGELDALSAAELAALAAELKQKLVLLKA